VSCQAVVPGFVFSTATESAACREAVVIKQTQKNNLRSR